MRLCALAFVLTFAFPTIVFADVFDAYKGRWSGSGSVIISDEKSENIRCVSTYIPDGGSTRVRIGCATPSFKVEVICSLRESSGRLSGSCEMTTHGLTGSVSGSISGTALSAHIGGELNASVTIGLSGNRQSASVTPGNKSLFRKLNVTMTK